MQKTKDIQHDNTLQHPYSGCGLMQKTKDIQHNPEEWDIQKVVV